MKSIKTFEQINEPEINEAGAVRIRLTEEDFRTLVSGGTVDTSKEIHAGPEALIILADIGFDTMLRIIKEAMKK